MNWLFVPQVSQSSPYSRVKSDIRLAISPVLENACGMEIYMKYKKPNNKNKPHNISDNDRDEGKNYITLMNENLDLLKQELYQ